MQPEEGLFAQQLSIEIEVGVGPQDRMAQSQFLAQHQQWLTGFAIPAGGATVEHAIKTQAKIGKLQGVPFDGLMMSEEEVAQAQGMQQQMAQLQQQMEQMGQQIEQAGQFIGKLQQENQSLQQKAQANNPETKMVELQADMQVERVKAEKDLIVAREKMAQETVVKREEMEINAQLQREKMMLEAQLKAAHAQQAAEQSIMMQGQPIQEATAEPTAKQIGIVRDESGLIVGAEVVEDGAMGQMRKKIDILRDKSGLIVGAEVTPVAGE